MLVQRITELKEQASRNAILSISFFFVTILLIVLSLSSFFLLKEGLKRKHGSEYINEIIQYNDLDEKDKKKFAEDNFSRFQYKPHKFLWGLKVLEIARTEKNEDKEIEILDELVWMNVKLPELKLILSIELLNKQMELGLPLSSKLFKRVKRARRKQYINSLINEVLLNKILEDGNQKLYIQKSKVLLNDRSDSITKRSLRISQEINKELQKK